MAVVFSPLQPVLWRCDMPHGDLYIEANSIFIKILFIQFISESELMALFESLGMVRTQSSLVVSSHSWLGRHWTLEYSHFRKTPTAEVRQRTRRENGLVVAVFWSIRCSTWKTSLGYYGSNRRDAFFKILLDFSHYLSFKQVNSSFGL